MRVSGREQAHPNTDQHKLPGFMALVSPYTLLAGTRAPLLASHTSVMLFEITFGKKKHRHEYFRVEFIFDFPSEF